MTLTASADGFALWLGNERVGVFRTFGEAAEALRAAERLSGLKTGETV